jgi:hypothetical protein
VSLAVSFAWIESAVVVYLREIFFEGGFSFPLVIIWQDGKRIVDPLVRIEFFREIATLIVLCVTGLLAGKKGIQKLCFSMIAFGIWDIFYYIWLYVMVGWPESLTTWDLLFYVPLPWVGPVITPILIAVAMVMAGSFMIYFDYRGCALRWQWYDIVVALSCTFLMIVAFCWDWKNIMQIPGDMARTGVPNPFAWWLFLPSFIFSLIYFYGRLHHFISMGRSKVS